MSGPAVQVAAYTAEALGTVGKGEFWRLHRFAGSKSIFRHFAAATGHDVVTELIVGIDSYFVVSAPAEHCPDSRPVVFPWLPVERQHDFGMVGMRVSRPLVVFDCFDTASQRFACEVALGSPVAVEVRQPNVAAPYGQKSGIETADHELLFALVGDFAPRLDDVVGTDGEIIEFYSHRVVLVL